MKKFSIIFVLFELFFGTINSAEESKFYDLTTETNAYTDKLGYGYDFKIKPQSAKIKNPALFSIKVPDGKYKVTFEVGLNEFEFRNYY